MHYLKPWENYTAVASKDYTIDVNSSNLKEYAIKGDYRDNT